MPSQYNAEKKSIGELLSMTSPPIVVPEWQRNYSWSVKEAEIFWHDLLAFNDKYTGENISNEEYFLGSIVMVNTGRSNLILDGQQRLATSTILLSVIRDHIKRYRDNSAARLSHRFLTDIDDATDKRTYKMTLNRFDRDFFKRVILDSPADLTLEPTIYSHVRIQQVKEFFLFLQITYQLLLYHQLMKIMLQMCLKHLMIEGLDYLHQTC